MARITRQHAALVKAYAQANGISPRTAQHHRKTQDPRWVSFAQVHGMTLAKVPFQPSPFSGPAVPEDYVPEDFRGFELPEEMERRHEVIWRNAAELAEKANALNWATAPLLTKAATDARKAYQEARAARVRWEEEVRRVIPAGEFIEFAELLHRVAALGRGIVRELGELVNPDRPEVGIAVLTSWVESRWNPSIDDLISIATGKGPLKMADAA